MRRSMRNLINGRIQAPRTRGLLQPRTNLNPHVKSSLIIPSSRNNSQVTLITSATAAIAISPVLSPLPL
jgi:hypothetical protein